MNASLKAFAHVANGAADPKRFAGAFEAARKTKVHNDVYRPKGHNREHAWILWSKIQRGHITHPATIAALGAEYGKLFKEFANTQAI